MIFNSLKYPRKNAKSNLLDFIEMVCRAKNPLCDACDKVLRASTQSTKTEIEQSDPSG